MRTERMPGAALAVAAPHGPATSASPHVANTDFSVPSFWSSDGYSALTVSSFLEEPGAVSNYPASWSGGVWTMHCSTAFMKHEFPRLCRPQPGGSANEDDWAMVIVVPHVTTGLRRGDGSL